MFNIKELTTNELIHLQNEIEKELNSRNSAPPATDFVVYYHDCINTSNYHKSKYKHWSKLVNGIDPTKANGYAFIGEFLKFGKEHKVPVGSIVVEVCDNTIDAYQMDKDKTTLIERSNTNKMTNFIDVIRKKIHDPRD